MTEEWCLQQLEHLKIKEERTSTLNEIRVKLRDSGVVSGAVNHLLKSEQIFDCFEENSESVQKDMATDILIFCMSQLSIAQSDLSQVLEKSLTHKKPKIRAIALNTILKEVQKNSIQSLSSFPDDISNIIIECLRSPESSVGVPAAEILSKILVVKLNSDIVKALFNQIAFGDIAKCRVYEVAVNLAKYSAENQKKLEIILDDGLSQLNNSDVLLQVNILEIFVALAEQNHGLIFLEQREVFEKISKRVTTLEENPIDRLLIPGIMKFFGKVAIVQPQKIIIGYPDMILCLFDCFHLGDPSILPTAFDTFANLAYTQQGKILMDSNYAENLKEVFADYVQHLGNLPTDLKNRAFNSLEIVFLSDGPPVSAEVSKIMEKWYSYLFENQSMQFMMDFCKNPFPDIKVACLKFVKAICTYQWGVMALKKTGGFLEYLLDRRAEFDKDAKLTKFEIIQLIADSPVFDLQTQLQLKTYVNEGPYYVQGIVEIAVEGS